MKVTLRSALVMLLVVIPATGTLGDTAESERLIKDCGVNSLYLLLRLRETPVNLAQLRAMLPDTKANGLSMAELQAAAGRYGVTLRGKRIGSGDVPIDRPIITLLRSDEDQGHFVVLEPVGVLGKSVMVLDFPRPAQIVAYADLMKSGGWTGLALAPATYWERIGRWAACGAGVLLTVFGLALPRIRRLATRRRHQTSAIDQQFSGNLTEQPSAPLI